MRKQFSIFNFQFSIPRRGFTLVELLVSVSLFTVITFFSLGALLTIYDGYKKSQSSKTVVDNLNLSIENMARTIRFGGDYHCSSNPPFTTPMNCRHDPADTFLAVTFEGSQVAYRLSPDGAAIQRSDNPDGGESTYVNITSPEVTIEHLGFYVAGAQNANEQPYVVVVIKGYVGAKPTIRTTFSIQTLMSQRTLNI